MTPPNIDRLRDAGVDLALEAAEIQGKQLSAEQVNRLAAQWVQMALAAVAMVTAPQPGDRLQR